MKLGPILLTLAMAALLSGCGSGSSDNAAAADTSTPKPRVHDRTAAENAKAIENNPNLSPEVKKVLGGAGK